LLIYKIPAKLPILWAAQRHPHEKDRRFPDGCERRARKVQALPRLQKCRPANGPAHDALVGYYYLRRRIA
jgi:hypothetical protein